MSSSDELLHGRIGLGRPAESAEYFGLRLSHAHTVAVAQGPTVHAEGDPTPGRWNGRPSPASATSASYSQDGRLLRIASGRQDEVLAYLAKQAHAATDGGRAAIGPTQPGPGGVVQSYEAALNDLQQPSASTSATRCCATPICWSTPSLPATASPGSTSSSTASPRTSTPTASRTRPFDGVSPPPGLQNIAWAVRSVRAWDTGRPVLQSSPERTGPPQGPAAQGFNRVTENHT
ncbi:hypothetical protein GCM10022233_70640 [Streptomyces shaanxiensis]|uniref:CdaR GGDEF-like domain-containing protein n=1 Tax=Streptomyces shaanxiensis TaxID=653357 RepID=A0ABP7W3H5_9ACTN